MKLRAPELPAALPLCEDFLAAATAAAQSDDEVSNCRIQGAQAEGADFARLTFRRVVFENCRLINCDFTRCDIADVRFCGCDLSGSRFDDASFYRAEFTGVKALGLCCRAAVLRHVRVEGGVFQYACLDDSELRTAHILESDWREALLARCRLADLTLRGAKLTGASLHGTPLRGVDFTSCDIEGINLSREGTELRGAIVNVPQAADLARLLGVVIR